MIKSGEVHRNILNSKMIIFILLVTFLPTAKATNEQDRSSQVHNLMPAPVKIDFGDGELAIDADFSVLLTGKQEPRLNRAVDRMMERITSQTGIIFPPKGNLAGKEPVLKIKVIGYGEAVQSPDEDESYSLVIDSLGAQLIAPTPVGMLRGIETFLQLIEPGRNGYKVPYVIVVDYPRFTWRGLLLDACRHWMPVEVVKRTLDAMASVKMNVLHWHLSEDQGFRVESKLFPKLQELGSDGHYYTQEQIREIVEYARDRGIRVVPEFDMPGHTSSWFVGYPELASMDEPQYIRRRWGVHLPVMDPTKEEVYDFIDRFIGEMATLFPDSYFHIGGDEVEDDHWQENPRIQAFMRSKDLADSAALQAWFNDRLHQILKKYGKRMVGWDEILHPDLPNDILVQSWRGQDSLAAGARKGYSGILSHGYYLDLFYSAAEHYAVDPLSGAAASLSESEKALILGGEACMWSELITPELIDGRIWPRAAAIAERLWSPATVVDADDMYRRLEIQSKRLERLGLNHRCIERVLMERMVGPNDSIEGLQFLAGALEPVKGYGRHRTKPYTSSTPLNRLVDAVPAESSVARVFNRQVARMLSSTEGWNEESNSVIAYLKQLKDNHQKIKQLLEKSYLLQEIVPLSETVSFLAGAALEAIEMIEMKLPPSPEWMESVGEELDVLGSQESSDGKAPTHELRIAILPGLRQIVQRCIDSGQS